MCTTLCSDGEDEKAGGENNRWGKKLLINHRAWRKREKIKKVLAVPNVKTIVAKMRDIKKENSSMFYKSVLSIGN